MEPGRNGLVEGVGREVFEVKTLTPLTVPTGEILEGSVPARPLLAGLLIPVSVKGTRSGNPSWDGDSGISNRGVEVPLVGGPQILGEIPACDCSSRVRLGNSLEACSCRGEPAPTLAPDKPASADEGLAPPKGDFVVGIDEGSVIGFSPDRFMLSWLSGLVVGTMMNVLCHCSSARILQDYLARAFSGRDSPARPDFGYCEMSARP